MFIILTSNLGFQKYLKIQDIYSMLKFTKRQNYKFNSILNFYFKISIYIYIFLNYTFDLKI